MKFIPAFCLSIIVLAGCGKNNGGTSELKTEKDSVSYSIGLDIGRTLQRQEIEIAPNAFLQGLIDATDSTSKHLLTDEQLQAVMMAFQQKMIAKAQEKLKAQAGKAGEEGEKFLAENKTKPGVVTLPSGLQYKVITMGKGKKPKAANEVKVHYRGMLLNGIEFDNSYKRGEPVTFPVNGVIPGWTEALQLMPAGSKWQLFVPSNLAYGDNPAGQIPPGSVLIFDIELLGIVK
ncbi:MAG: FKBP-type peptidyl-prolyl cis-trans isomerase [Bacteroidetes bacterium]|nr:FKBP-type peptidyl-prolyl cis-trans isomerase [Bacteroidota bacterium]